MRSLLLPLPTRLSPSLLLLCIAVLPPSSMSVQARDPLTIKVIPDGFGASEADISAVCRSAAQPLLAHMPDLAPAVVIVTRGQHNPIALFARGAQGEFQVRLNTEKTYWAQYAYQFAHELCHVLCRCEDDYQGNLWFEETLAEVASLYCLRTMSVTWRDDPPYPNWASFAPKLRDYTDEISRRRDDHLEILRTGLPAYYRKHANHLTTHSTDRDKNGAIALALLPLLERDPKQWNAIRWVNSSPSPPGETFTQYLAKWHRAAPAEHRTFVSSLAAYFGIDLSQPIKPGTP